MTENEKIERELEDMERELSSAYRVDSIFSKMRFEVSQFNFPEGLKDIRIKQTLEVPGVYIFIQSETKQVIYIGQSKDLYTRLVSHQHTKPVSLYKKLIVLIREDRFEFERLTLEAQLIKKLKPKENRRYFEAFEGEKDNQVAAKQFDKYL